MDSLRYEIAKVIRETFEDAYNKHNENYNPDTCYAAAGNVAAMLVQMLSGQPCNAEERGSGKLVLKPDRIF
jgi:hypothetical protein